MNKTLIEHRTPENYPTAASAYSPDRRGYPFRPIVKVCQHVVDGVVCGFKNTDRTRCKKCEGWL